MKLDDAQLLATELLAEIQPFCHRAEIAGSIRRGKREVKDVELVVIPKWEPRPDPNDLFGAEVNTNLLYLWATGAQKRLTWIKPGTSQLETWPLKPDGKYWRGLFRDFNDLENPKKLDLFIATPENWGLMFCIRTGSADFSTALVTLVRDNSWYIVEDGNLHDQASGRVVPVPEEIDLFKKLGVTYVEPADRSDAGAIRLGRLFPEFQGKRKDAA